MPRSSEGAPIGNESYANSDQQDSLEPTSQQAGDGQQHGEAINTAQEDTGMVPESVYVPYSGSPAVRLLSRLLAGDRGYWRTTQVLPEGPVTVLPEDPPGKRTTFVGAGEKVVDTARRAIVLTMGGIALIASAYRGTNTMLRGGTFSEVLDDTADALEVAGSISGALTLEPKQVKPGQKQESPAGDTMVTRPEDGRFAGTITLPRPAPAAESTAAQTSEGGEALADVIDFAERKA